MLDIRKLLFCIIIAFGFTARASSVIEFSTTNSDSDFEIIDSLESLRDHHIYEDTDSFYYVDDRSSINGSSSSSESSYIDVISKCNDYIDSLNLPQYDDLSSSSTIGDDIHVLGEVQNSTAKSVHECNNMLSNIDHVLDNLLFHTTQIHYTSGVASGDAPSTSYYVRSRIFSGYAKYYGNDSHKAQTYRNQGVIIGQDLYTEDDLTFGVSYLTNRSTSAASSIDVNLFSVYGSKILDSNTDFFGSLSYGKSFGDNVNGSMISGAIKVAQGIPLVDRVTFVPKIGINVYSLKLYNYTDSFRYREQGIGSNLGAAVNKEIYFKKVTLIPELEYSIGGKLWHKAHSTLRGARSRKNLHHKLSGSISVNANRFDSSIGYDSFLDKHSKTYTIFLQARLKL